MHLVSRANRNEFKEYYKKFINVFLSVFESFDYTYGSSNSLNEDSVKMISHSCMGIYYLAIILQNDFKEYVSKVVHHIISLNLIYYNSDEIIKYNTLTEEKEKQESLKKYFLYIN